MIRVVRKSTTYRILSSKNSSFLLFTIFRLTRSKNILMDFIECEKVYWSFKDDQFYLQKKGFCKIDIDNDQDI
ncbi:hypothetical protein BpHYR1_002423, partial [Brachionus plicatilis]